MEFWNSNFEFGLEKYIIFKMINKDSLLDAYMTLSGSPTLHIAMLIAFLVVCESPDDIDESQAGS